jgi:hypothetical protein
MASGQRRWRALLLRQYATWLGATISNIYALSPPARELPRRHQFAMLPSASAPGTRGVIDTVKIWGIAIAHIFHLLDDSRHFIVRQNRGLAQSQCLHV